MKLYLYQFLMFFRNIFFRHSTCLLFLMVILEFIGIGEMFEISFFVDFRRLKKEAVMLYFFLLSLYIF